MVKENVNEKKNENKYSENKWRKHTHKENNIDCISWFCGTHESMYTGVFPICENRGMPTI